MIDLIQAEQKLDGFHLLFKRPFATCDPRDYVIEVGDVRVCLVQERRVCDLNEGFLFFQFIERFISFFFPQWDMF